MKKILDREIRAKRAVVLASSISAFSIFLWFIGGHTFCYFRSIFGIPCPGCGMSRAWISFFKTDFASAFRFHPLFWVVPVIAVVIIFKKNSVIKKINQSYLFWIVTALAFISVYIIRMYFLFPNTPPLQYNNKSILAKVVLYLADLLLSK